MKRVVIFLLLAIATLLLVLTPGSHARYESERRGTQTTHVGYGRSHHKRVSKYDYGQGVSFQATVLESTLDDDYESVIPRSNSLHDPRKFRIGNNYRR